ncbi:MAG: nucleotidyltransferase [Clostridia bacterium]|nr:nucleotidyltransferase [Clostridia bacterium]
MIRDLEVEKNNNLAKREEGLTLTILAAGMGSRFGGLKQIQPVDEDQNFIIDYSLFDAKKAGFTRVIFVIKEEFADVFKSTIGKRAEAMGLDVEYAFQRMEDVPEGTKVPEGRVKPFGTAHALYAIRHLVDEKSKFAIINADDYYGSESFQIMADALRDCEYNEFVNTGFYTKNTLSENGAVKRGIFEVEKGIVKGLEESEIERRADGKVYATPLDKNEWRVIDEKTPVSMNMFGFTYKIIEKLKTYLEDFFANANLEKGEALIPEVVNDLIREGEVSVKLKKTPSEWIGITYKSELDKLIASIRRLKDEGKYPEHLLDTDTLER